MLALLAILFYSGIPRRNRLSPELRIACGGLAAFTAVGFASALWASSPELALEGAGRTLLYLLVFSLVLRVRMTAPRAGALLCGWLLAMIALAAYCAARMYLADPTQLGQMFVEGRLTFPSGYANASAAQWLMVFFPALVLVALPALGRWLRSVLAAGCVLSASLALMSESRGALLASLLVLLLAGVLALARGHARELAMVAPILAAVALAAPSVLAVGNHLTGERVETARVDEALGVVLALAVLAGAALAVLTSLEATRSDRRQLALLAATGLLAAVGATVIYASGPAAARRTSAVPTAAGSGRPETPASNGSRLFAGLGTGRYDIYRVAFDEFRSHPLLGIGIDNFGRSYLRRRHSHETPQYPHSLELGALAETGLLGSLALLVALGAALRVAIAGVLQGPEDRLRQAVASAALAGVAYWLIHASIDWFWEIAGLTAPAFALLAIACSLAPHRPDRGHPADAAAFRAARASRR